ncbi:lipase secretion chaperone [Vibrio sp. 10N.261.46.E12]|uniref:lipase secretion chaperone n=1 Tax=unclassified Vibrio TaxID=2614977 RepID=UPI00097881D4|nr:MULTISPECIES: lipase secretion chaperone [unclassified Vibrio]OMO34998.1 lipase chaperone [Vibrio sp. 10N.261.45.E1]PMJ28553.1 lipase chaperone [Vibrio sp. 10N.286.45.B6]PML98592.1 lipase chaperone [Vibrio sp. 10N.261.49.E11]PMM68181.1 lipase chaperone [Vibrio sp. 10N.261.46.F12]PMM82987.1 lipase chaperone [Vibrio sp. 10N.261.46.E8]
MKKAAILSITTIALMSIAAVFLYPNFFPVKTDELSTNKEIEHSASSLKATSQQDTEIDNASAKDMMEYFVSGNTELTLEDIRDNVAKHQAESPTVVVDEALFTKYLEYKSALASLDVQFDSTSISAVDLRALNQALLDLQVQFFSQSEISILFTHDNRMREIALEKLLLQQEGLDESEYQQRLESYLSEQPDYVQTSQQNQVLLQQLSSSEGLDQQDKYLKRSELVGEEATQRLEALDKQRAAFEDSLEVYFVERNDVLNDSTLSQTEQQETIAQLRTAHFLPKQIRRVEAIERIRAAESGQ